MGTGPTTPRLRLRPPPARANVDGSNGSTITGPSLGTGLPPQSYTFNSATPFTDTHSNTLADVAMYYWNRDLHTGLANRVPTSTINPAFWQHMVTYGVALGATGSIDATTALNAITAAPRRLSPGPIRPARTPPRSTTCCTPA